MRAIIFVAAGVGVSLSGAASAQSAKNTPAGIVCAMTGSCDEPQGDRVPVGNEKAFSLSLARPAATAPAASAVRPRVTAVAPVARPRMMTSTRMAAVAPRAAAPAKVQPGGGLDMLVTFKLGSAEMTPQAMSEARAFAQAMALPQMAGMRFAIEGHTDASGSRDANLSLSQARAQSVMDYLVAQGIDAGRLSAKGYGPDKPIRGTRATSPANRRVEFVKQI